VEKGGVVSINYSPSRESGRGSEDPSTQQRFAQLRANAAAAARLGVSMGAARIRALRCRSDVATDQATTGRQLDLEINRDTAARLGIDPATVDNTLYDAFGQRHVASTGDAQL
jgi:multidrug efflux pump subunit AcrB